MTIDNRERGVDLTEVMRTAMDAREINTWQGGPGIIVSFDADAMTAVVQPAIQAKVSTPDGSVSLVDMPLLLDVPVIFPSGGGATLTFPIAAGDEAWFWIADRCIDSWWQSGGVQAPISSRLHDLSDACCMVGPRSQPRKLPGLSTTNAQLRSDDGETFIELDPEGQAVKIVAPGGLTAIAAGGALIQADTRIEGTLHVTGTISTDADVLAATGDVVAGTVSLKDHLTSGVLSGGAVSGPPVP